MSNCLVTRLKGTVNDNTLPKYWITRFIVKPNSDVQNPTEDNLKFQIMTTEDTQLSVVGNGHVSIVSFADISASQLKKVEIAADTLTTVYCEEPVDDEGYSLEILSFPIKKLIANEINNANAVSDISDSNLLLVSPVFENKLPNLEELNYNGGYCTGTIDIFAGNSKLTGMVACICQSANFTTTTEKNKNGITGDIQSFGDAISIERICINGHVTGSIESLANLINLKKVWVGTTDITGNLLYLALGQIANGRATPPSGSNYNQIYFFRPFTPPNSLAFGSKTGITNRYSIVNLRWDNDKVWCVNRNSSTQAASTDYIYFYKINQDKTDEAIIADFVSNGYVSDNIQQVSLTEE